MEGGHFICLAKQMCTILTSIQEHIAHDTLERRCFFSLTVPGSDSVLPYNGEELLQCLETQHLVCIQRMPAWLSRHSMVWAVGMGSCSAAEKNADGFNIIDGMMNRAK